VERIQKWRKRRPYAMWIFVAAALAIVTICGVGLLHYEQQIQIASSTLAQSEREFGQQDFADSIEHAQLSLNALASIPWQTELKNRARQQLVAAQHKKAVADLHEFVEKLRFFDGQQLGRQALVELAEGCRKIWQSRQVLIGGPNADGTGSGGSGLEKSLRQD